MNPVNVGASAPPEGMGQSKFPSVPVLSIRVTALGMLEHVATIVGWARTGSVSRVVCIANVHMTVHARREVRFGEVLSRADLTAPDGMPLVWVMRHRGAQGQERVAGMDLLPALCAAAERHSIPVFFVGSTPEVLEAIRRRLATEHPELKVVGMATPPFRAATADEDAALVREIEISGARLVFVSLGCPKQELWMDAHRGQVRAVMVGLGAAFSVFARLEPRAPRLLQRMGLEWAFRLAREPRRLWKRYLVTNTLFLCYHIADWFRRA